MKIGYRLSTTVSCLLLTSVLCSGQLHAADPYKWCAVDSGGEGHTPFLRAAAHSALASRCINAARRAAGWVYFVSQNRSCQPIYLRRQELRRQKQTQPEAE